MKKKILVLVSTLLIIFGTVYTVFATDDNELKENSIAHLSEVGAFIAFNEGTTKDEHNHVVSANYAHTGDTFITEAEYNDGYLSRDELKTYRDKIESLLSRCNCISNSKNISHWGHRNCSLSDKWENVSCSHKSEWEELFRKFANTMYNNSYYEFNCSWATLKSNLQTWINKGNQHYTIDELIDMLNSKNPNILLSHFPSLFCIKHNHPLYYKEEMHLYHGSPFLMDTYYQLTWNNYNDTGTGSRVGTPNTNDKFNWTYNISKSKSADESKDVVVNYSNIKFLHSGKHDGNCNDMMNLKAVQSPLENDGNVYDLAYIVTFTEKVDGVDAAGYNTYDGTYANGYTTKYTNEAGQRAIWGNTGDGAATYQNDALYHASTGFDGYEESRNTNGTSVSVTPYKNAGTVIRNSDTVYQVGPFHMDNYTYAYCSYAANYSGKAVHIDKGLFGGIIDAYIILKDDYGKEYKLYIDGSSVKVVYSGWDSSIGNIGDNNRYGTDWTYPTKSDNAASGVSGYIYPWPNSDFYININRNTIKDIEAKGLTLTSMKFLYRTTVSEGNGWVCKSRLIQHTWKVDQTSSNSGDTYYCTDSGVCKRTGIAYSIRSDATDGKHKRYCVTKGYCQYGTSGAHPHCSHGSNTCSCAGYACPGHGHSGCAEGCTSSHKCGSKHYCSNSTSILTYCQHGYSDGDHATYSNMKSWGTHSYDYCYKVTRCETHKTNNGQGKISGSSSHHYGLNDQGHTTCHSSKWVDTDGGKLVITDGQPLLAIHHANVYVRDNGYGSSYSGGTVRLTTDLTVDKYIVKVEHTGVEETTFNSETERKNRLMDDKYADFVKLERGDKITFYIDLKNDQAETVQYKIHDSLPEYTNVSVTIRHSYNGGAWTPGSFTSTSSDVWTFEDGYGGFYITGEINGYSVYRFIVELQATVDSEYDYNEVEISYKNSGNEDYIRTSENRANVFDGPVVNYAEIDGDQYSKIEDGDRFFVKAYSVPVDKYITKVEHVGNEEVVYERRKQEWNPDRNYDTNPYNSEEKYYDRDTINKDSNFKKNSAIYLEYGDAITYNIDLQNTYHTDEGKTIDRDLPPYYNPDGVKVNLTDTLPVDENGNVAINNIVVRYIYVDSEGNTKTYTFRNGIVTTITDWRYTNESSANKTTKGRIDFEAKYTISGKYIYFENFPVTEQTESYIEISGVINTPEFKTNAGTIEYENKVQITSVKNLNDFEGSNRSTRTVSSDYFILSEYKAIIDNYVVKTDAKMLKQNYDNGFEELYTYYTDLSEEGDDIVTQTRVTSKTTVNNLKHDRRIADLDESGEEDAAERTDIEEDRPIYPVPTEKGERVTYEIRVDNRSKETIINTTSAYKDKYATRIRTSQIKYYLEEGLEFKTVTATIYRPNGTSRISPTISYAKQPIEKIGGKDYNVYMLNLADKDSGQFTTLEPNEYIVYTVVAEVSKSNMYLHSLETKAVLHKLTNINNGDNSSILDIFDRFDITDLSSIDRPRIVTEQNTVRENQKYSSDFIKLKDLIIAGKVWLDLDKDGYMKPGSGLASVKDGDSSNIPGTDDRVMEGIKVHLYSREGTLIRTVTTDANGLYSFARQENSNSAYRKAVDQRILKAEKNNKNAEKTLAEHKDKKENLIVNYNNNSDYIRYYVEFEYDGVLYKATNSYSSYDNLDNYGAPESTKKLSDGTLKYKVDSNADEFIDARERFNKRYETVTYNKSYPTTADGTRITNSNGAIYTFDKDGHNSYLNIDHSRNMESRSFVTVYNAQEVKDALYYAVYKCSAAAWLGCSNHEKYWKVLIDNGIVDTAKYSNDASGRDDAQDDLQAVYDEILNDADANGNKQSNKFLWLFDYNQKTAFKTPETEYLKYINLGLQEREDIDLSLTKDVYEVKTTINAEEMSYSFDRLEVDELTIKNKLKQMIDNRVKELYGNKTDFTKISDKQFDDIIKGLGLDVELVNANKEENDIVLNLNGNLDKFISVTGYTPKYLEDYIIKEPYGMTLYETDFKYRVTQYKNGAVQAYKGKESELNAEVIYKININNDLIQRDDHILDTEYDYIDKKLYTTIHEITEFYDSNFINAFEDERKDFNNNIKIDYNKNEETGDLIENIDGDLVSTKDYQNRTVKDDKIEINGKQEYEKTGDLENKDIAVAQAWYLRKATNAEKNNKNIVKYKATGERSATGNYVREYLEICKDSLFSDNVNMPNFNTLYIRPKGERELRVDEGENIVIYVKYMLAKDGEELTDSRDLKIANERSISQINAYSVWYQENDKPASIVDKDSNAGNIGYTDVYNPVNEELYGKYDANDKIRVLDEADANLYEDTVHKTNIDIKAVNVENISGTKSDEIAMVRTMSGRVWDDARSEEITESGYTQYYGDGIYGEGTADESKVRINKNVETSYVGKNENEKDDLLVRNAKVEFIEIVKIKQPDGSYRYYEEKVVNNGSVKQNTRTDENGNYKLYGFMPGYYIVRFTYGDTATGTGYANAATDMQLFNGHDYKSTQYTGVEDTETDSDAIILKMQEVNNSDAKDDEIRRLESIAYSETMVNEKAEILKGSANGKYITVRDARSDADLEENQKIANTPEQLKALTENTYMYADTVTFYVKPEKLDWLTPVKTEAEAKDESKDVTYRDLKGPIIYDELTDLDFNHTKSNVRKNFNIENLDFGIEYRPESQISLSKEVSGVKLTTSDGKVLVKLALETMEKGKQEEQYHRIIEDKSIGVEYVQFISNIYGEYDTENKYINLQNLTSEKEDGQGFIFINVDDEILQGSTIEIEYSFTAENNSEIDRINNRLDNLRYRENGDNITNYANKFAYVKLDEDINVYNKLYADAEVNDDNKYVYTAAGTARNILYDEYYKDDENGDTYRTKTLTTYDLKEVELAGNKNAKSIVIDQQDEKVYYGRYLGKFYYLAADDNTDLDIDNDVISSLKFDKILDYIDTDLVYSPAETGKEKNTLWSTATDADLLNVFVRYPKVTTGTSANSLLQNAKDIAYVTYNGDKPLTSNLVISVDDRLKDGDGTHVVNEELSKFLKPYYKTGDVANGKEADSIGKIKLTVSKVIGAESALNEDDMQYENLAEVIQFTAQTGRRTNYATTIGNAMVHKGEFSEATTEPDTSATELITLTPPTGLNRINRVIRDVVETTGKGIGFGVVGVALVFAGLVIVRFIIKKIKKRPIK